MNPVKTIYQFALTVQILCLIVFLGYLIESGIDLTIPINFTISANYKISFNFRFNYVTIIAFISVTGLIYILSSVNVLGGGLTDEGTITIRKHVSFFAQFSILLTPILYIFALSTVLNEFAVAITLVLLVIHFLNFMEEQKGENN